MKKIVKRDFSIGNTAFTTAPVVEVYLQGVDDIYSLYDCYNRVWFCPQTWFKELTELGRLLYG